MDNSSDILSSFANLDHTRGTRTGIPEAVLAESKTAHQVSESLLAFVRNNGLGIATRVSPEQAEDIIPRLGKKVRTQWNRNARLIVAASPDHTVEKTGAKVAVFAAGTSDVSVAEESKITAECMGCTVFTFYDVGIAGIHRLIEPVATMTREEIPVAIAVAGMEGALPSVLRGLVSVPVIGVPTSVGYGYGGKGEGALMTMLQSCSPGLTVVNIDNGFGAGSTAALIANIVVRRYQKAKV